MIALDPTIEVPDLDGTAHLGELNPLSIPLVIGCAEPGCDRTTSAMVRVVWIGGVLHLENDIARPREWGQHRHLTGHLACQEHCR